MRPSVRLVRYLAALAPLALGALLGGCGGLLGSLDGQVPAPTITVANAPTGPLQAGQSQNVTVVAPEGTVLITAVSSDPELLTVAPSAQSRQVQRVFTLTANAVGREGQVTVTFTAIGAADQVLARTSITVRVAHAQGSGGGG